MWKGRKGVPRKLKLLWKIRPPHERVLVEGPGHENERRRILEPKGTRKKAERTGIPFERSTVQFWTVEEWQHRMGNTGRT